jgi:hypothetical protein
MQRFDHTVTKLRKGRSSGKTPFEKKCELCSAGYTSEKTSQSAHPTGLVMFASHVNTIDANPASKASRFHNIAGRSRERQRVAPINNSGACKEVADYWCSVNEIVEKWQANLLEDPPTTSGTMQGCAMQGCVKRMKNLPD